MANLEYRGNDLQKYEKTLQQEKMDKGEIVDLK